MQQHLEFSLYCLHWLWTFPRFSLDAFPPWPFSSPVSGNAIGGLSCPQATPHSWQLLQVVSLRKRLDFRVPTTELWSLFWAFRLKKIGVNVSGGHFPGVPFASALQFELFPFNVFIVLSLKVERDSTEKRREEEVETSKVQQK